MQALLSKVQTTITDFIEQRDALWLRVAGRAADAPLVFKLLLAIERRNRSDVFLLCSTPFVSAAQYVDALVGLFRSEHQALQQARQARQLPALPPLPARFSGEPAQRLSQLLDAAQALLPPAGTTRLVWAFWPLELADLAAYERLLDAVVPAAVPAERDPAASAPPATSPLRLIGRQVGDLNASARCPADAGRTLRTTTDFSPQAVQRCLEETLIDQSQPVAVRMHTLLMLATLDQAHGRDQAALARYELLLEYSRNQCRPLLQTVVLLQLGELCQRQQRLPAARAFYEQALTPAAAAKVPICTALLAKHLGDLATAEQRHADAAACYEAWHRLAGLLDDRQGAQLGQAKLTAAQERSAWAAAPHHAHRCLELSR